MREFVFRLKVKGCKKVFKEELGPGVIAAQGVTFGAEPYKGALAVALLREEELFIQRIIEVQIEEIENGSYS